LTRNQRELTHVGDILLNLYRSEQFVMGEEQNSKSMMVAKAKVQKQ